MFLVLQIHFEPWEVPLYTLKPVFLRKYYLEKKQLSLFIIVILSKILKNIKWYVNVTCFPCRTPRVSLKLTFINSLLYWSTEACGAKVSLMNTKVLHVNFGTFSPYVSKFLCILIFLYLQTISDRNNLDSYGRCCHWLLYRMCNLKFCFSNSFRTWFLRSLCFIQNIPSGQHLHALINAGQYEGNFFHILFESFSLWKDQSMLSILWRLGSFWYPKFET